MSFIENIECGGSEEASSSVESAVATCGNLGELDPSAEIKRSAASQPRAPSSTPKRHTPADRMITRHSSFWLRADMLV